MKTHSIRAIRLVAWRCVRAWLGLYAGTGEDLKSRWVLQRGEGNEVDEISPMPQYPSDLKDEYTSALGQDEGEKDLLPPGSWDQEVVGGQEGARLVEGGLEVMVRQRGVDPWILPLVEDVRSNEIQNRKEDLQYLDSEDLSLGIQPSELGKLVVVIEGVVAFREGLIPSISSSPQSSAVASVSSTESLMSSTTTTQEPEPFISTSSHSTLLRTLASHLPTRKPVLLTGSPSSGKQSSITHLWNLVHSSPNSSSSSPSSSSQKKTEAAKKRGLVIINLADRSLDSKSLLGSLSSAPSSSSTSTSTSGAGEFTFIEGPLTRALRQGRWTLLLNIDQAAPELLSVIKIVAERMHSSSLSRGGLGSEEQDGGVGVRLGDGKWIKAREGFMLFATRSVPISSISLSEEGVVTAPQASFFASHFFEEVVLEPLSNDEVGEIVKGRYEALERIVGLRECLVGAWEKVRDGNTRQSGTKEVGGSKRDVGVRDLLR